MSFLASIALEQLETLEDDFTALIGLLVTKGIFTMDEFEAVVAEVKRLKEENAKKKGTA